MLQIFLEGAKNLKIPDGKKANIIAQIKVTEFDLEAHSTPKNDIDSKSILSWNEHIFLEQKSCEREKLQKSII